jgi:hypothetical protein
MTMGSDTMTIFRSVLVSVMLTLSAAVVPVADARQNDIPAASAPCHFQLGFATLQALLPSIVGACQDDETYSANDDSVQHTTNGLLVWRMADNVTAFTDGYYTWVNGPAGLQLRLNTQRFAWETNPTGLPVMASGGTGIEGVTMLGPTTPVCRVGVPCSRPIGATLSITDATGRVILSVASGADGHFRADLPPGTYTLLPLPLQPGTFYPHAMSLTVNVGPGAYTHVDVVYDTGIR